MRFRAKHFSLHDKPRGEPSGHLPPEATIFFAQNHDQVGNRALGERLAKLIGRDKLKQAMVLLLLNPHIPMLFMGEEAAAETPFLFFADWSGEAADLTREGRRREFAHFSAFSTSELRDKIPNPCDEKTFLASKLDWNTIEHAPLSNEFRDLTRALLAIRTQKIVPLIKQGFKCAYFSLLGSKTGKTGLSVQWETTKGDVLQIVTNFGSLPLACSPLVQGETLYGGNDSATYLHAAEIIVRLQRAPAVGS